MAQITQKVCITGFPKRWNLKGHGLILRVTHCSSSDSARRESCFSAESDVTRLALVICRHSERELLSTNCWDAARTTHKQNKLSP